VGCLEGRVVVLVKVFEDTDLLVINKPAGMNTHSPSPCAGEGIYEWLRHREPRWAKLAIIHRLDKETSGVMVFGITSAANRSLTEQFTQHTVRKTYRLLTDRPVKPGQLTAVSSLVRAGERYVSRPLHAGGERAETRFQLTGTDEGRSVVLAEPITGRTHQIRVHASELGFPILGDTLYGGTPAPRVYLHAAELSLKHPISGAEMKFTAPVDFDADARLALREALIDGEQTGAWRMIHGAADGWPGWYVDRLGDYLLSQGERPLSERQSIELSRLMKRYSLNGAYHKLLMRQVRATNIRQASPQLALGRAAPEVFEVRENGVRFELSFAEGYSVGLFLDQRENRRRFLENHIGAGFGGWTQDPARGEIEVLNVFAYTCGFSVCAAKAGAKTTSLDLSKKYLEWGKRNFVANHIDPSGHEFIYGDAFDWLRRLASKGRRFDVVVLDPPTFSQSRQHGPFQAEKDYGQLVRAALSLLKPNGVLLASTNAARWKPEEFLETVTSAIRTEGRRILKQHYVPQPPDFPVHRDEPAYLKTVWMRVA
jgi:23S rRNA (cytosine1962-C5)-methyltransferase